MLWIVCAGALAAPAWAQPEQRDHRDRNDRDHRHGPPPTPPAATGPTEAPPAPQAENPGSKPGFDWIAGRWDWREGKWQWVAGHWERKHAGKHWRTGAWQQNGTQWTWHDGAWEAGETAPPPMPPTPDTAPGGTVVTTPPPGGPPHPDVRDHRRWTIDRPVVSSYWPTRGKPGARVVIRGENLPAGASVMWGTTQITGAKVTPNQIVFQVPAGAASGEITLHGMGRRDLPVGSFEVVTTGDPEADARKADEDRRKAAEAAWNARQTQLAKDRKARETAWQQHQQELDATREQRREQRMAEIRAKWEASFLADADAQAELTLHAQRLAQLQRAKDIAEVKSDGKLAVRVDVAVSRENDRHDQRMTALKDAFSTKGGAP
jgi:hypothetical protein